MFEVIKVCIVSQSKAKLILSISNLFSFVNLAIRVSNVVSHTCTYIITNILYNIRNGQV